MHRYQDRPTGAARGCPHRLRDRHGNCATCGAQKKANGRWEFLTPSWQHYYDNGGERPRED